jgi:hypothetical protein
VNTQRNTGDEHHWRCGTFSPDGRMCLLAWPHPQHDHMFGPMPADPPPRDSREGGWSKPEEFDRVPGPLQCSERQREAGAEFGKPCALIAGHSGDHLYPPIAPGDLPAAVASRTAAEMQDSLDEARNVIGYLVAESTLGTAIIPDEILAGAGPQPVLERKPGQLATHISVRPHEHELELSSAGGAVRCKTCPAVWSLVVE